MIFLNFIILLRVSWQTTNPQGSQDKNDCPNNIAHIQIQITDLETITIYIYIYGVFQS
jgi:hypothetical protein